MIIELFPPLAIHEKGQREGNEDCIYPSFFDRDRQASTRLFIVCDGVGGSEKGEEASRLACTVFADVLSHFNWVGAQEIHQALQLTETAMDRFVHQHADADGMATTLTLIAFHDKGATLAHIGDSRIYHLRQGRIMFRTNDHSMVNDMVAQKILTPAEALVHPKKNVISRAITGSRRPTKADVVHIADIQPDDFFFMCTDGVLESVSDVKLSQIIGEKGFSEETMLEHIFTLCRETSKDNFSAYLLHVKDVRVNDPALTNPQTAEFTVTPHSPNKSNLAFWLLSGIAGVAILLLIYLVIGHGSGETDIIETVERDSIDMVNYNDSLANLSDTTNLGVGNSAINDSLMRNDSLAAAIKADSLIPQDTVVVPEKVVPKKSKPKSRASKKREKEKVVTENPEVKPKADTTAHQ